MMFASLVQTIMNTVLFSMGKAVQAKRIDFVSRFVDPVVLVIVLYASSGSGHDAGP